MAEQKGGSKSTTFNPQMTDTDTDVQNNCILAGIYYILLKKIFCSFELLIILYMQGMVIYTGTFGKFE